jgi:uroporphyrinogen-III synthase
MRVVVTRPEPEGSDAVQRLAQHGIHANALPLIAIGPATQTPEFPAHCDAVMAVSANAVRGALAQPEFAQLLASNARFWATGSGTAAAWIAAGVPASRIDAPATQFDSEHLWQLVQPQSQPGKTVLILRGEDVHTPNASRDWLADQLRGALCHVRVCATYSRTLPAWTGLQLQASITLANDACALWWFSSSQAVHHLQQLLGQVNSKKALCTHPRIAQAATRAGFTDVSLCSPAFADVLASIKSIHDNAPCSP